MQLIFLLLATFAVASRLDAAPPAWWAQRGVTNANAADDYSLINQGQLKQLATQAYYEMEARLAGGAGPQLSALIGVWLNPPPPPYPQPSAYAVVNRGQLKNVARLFFDRMAQVGYVDPPVVSGRTYPWSPTNTDDDDYAYANIGLAKQLFSFDLATDTDGDGMPDWWERSQGLNPNAADAAADPDGDGLTNLQEYLIGRNPHTADAGVAGQLLVATPASMNVFLNPLTTTTRTVTLVNISNATVNYWLDNSSAAGAGANYRWADSDMPGGPTYVWNDISLSGTRLNTISNADDATVQIPNIGFQFPFYAGQYSSVWVTSNGYLTFGAQGSTQYNNDALPGITMPLLLVAPFFDDLISGDVYYKAEPGKLTVQFSNATHHDYPGAAYTFQVVLEQSGSVTCYYNSMTGTLNSATIGVQDGSNPPQGVQVALNQAYVHGNMAVRISPPGMVATGSLAPGQRTNASLVFNAGASQGIFTGSVALKNSLGQIVGLPVATSMTVSADFDGDGLSNVDEILHGTDPFTAGPNPHLLDSDGDGIPDYLDAYPFDATRWQPAVVDPNDHTPPAITLTKPLGATLQ